MERWTLGRMQNPVRGFIHGAAALLSVVGALILLTRARHHGAAVAWGVAVFGTALAGMYTVSTIYHSVPWTGEWKARLQRVDHSLIFVVVAGTFTPVALAGLEGWTRLLALSTVWLTALTGIGLKLLLPGVKTGLSVIMQLAMGWSALIWLPTLTATLGLGALLLLALGGLSYTTGAVIFAAKRPRLAPRVFSHHELFHVLVVLGSTLHFLAVLWYVVPLA